MGMACDYQGEFFKVRSILLLSFIIVQIDQRDCKHFMIKPINFKALFFLAVFIAELASPLVNLASSHSVDMIAKWLNCSCPIVKCLQFLMSASLQKLGLASDAVTGSMQKPMGLVTLH